MSFIDVSGEPDDVSDGPAWRDAVSVGIINEKPQILKLLESFESVVNGIGCCRDVEMSIKTNPMIPPISQKSFRINPVLSAEMRQAVEDLVEKGLVRKSMSPWASPSFFVEKKDGSRRLVIDYRRLNEATIGDEYRPPRIDDIVHRMRGAKFFSSLDLVSGFYQIPIREEDMCKTAFCTPFGLYEFSRMPFGLRNAPATFQRVMDNVLADCENTFVYIDDIVVFSATVQSHLAHIRKVLESLGKHGMTLKLSKCSWLCQEIHFCGHTLSPNGVIPLEDNIRKILERAVPNSRKSVRSFLGMSGFYRKFIRNYAELAEPLTRLTRENVDFQWGKEQVTSYDALVHSLCSRPLLGYPDWSKRFTIEVDASNVGIGAVVHQDGIPIEYGSRVLNAAESRYSTTEKEILAAVFFIEKFRYYLAGKEFTLVTDHQPFVFLQNQRDPHHKYARWVARLQSYSFEIRYKPGKDNTVPDFFSREPPRVFLVNASLQGDINGLLEGQATDPDISEFDKATLSPGNPYVKHRDTVAKLSNGLWARHGKPIVPVGLVREVVERVHSAFPGAHLGVNKTANQILRRYFWIGVKDSVKKILAECVTCGGIKGNGLEAPMKPLPAGNLFARLQIDFLGEFPETKKGNKYILTVVDTFSRYLFAEALPTKEALGVSRALVDRVIPFTGVPENIQSDNEKEFTGLVLEGTCRLLNTHHHTVINYHPQAQGVVERYNRTIKQMLLAYCNDHRDDWDDYLQPIVWSLRAQVHDDLGYAPAEIVLGRSPRTFDDLILSTAKTVERGYKLSGRAAGWKEELEQLRVRLADVHATVRARSGSASTKRSLDNMPSEIVRLNENSFVYVKDNRKRVNFKRKWLGPYKILKKISDIAYLIETDPPRIFHLSQLKPAQNDNNTGTLVIQSNVKRSKS